MRYGTLFSGIGAGDLGLQRAGFKAAWQCEYDPMVKTPMRRQWPVRVLRQHWPEVPNLGDIREVRRPESVDVVLFGSPCQDLSVAGRRAGLAGARSHLFFEAARVINECRPALAIWENVYGALSSDAGRDFWLVLYCLRELGANDVAWRVFDSQYAGVPQQRRRVYLVADFRGRRAGEILFEPDRCEGHPAPGAAPGEGVAGTLRGRSARAGVSEPGRGGEDDYNLVARPLGANATGGFRFGLDNDTYVTHTLRAEGADASEDGAGRGTPFVFEARYARNGRGSPREIVPSLKAQAGETGKGDGAPLAFTVHGTDKTRRTASPTDIAGSLRTKPPGSIENSSTTVIRTANTGANGKGVSEDVAYTLDGAQGQAVGLPYTVRRLTPTEAERLQGLPDGHTCLCGSGGDMYTCVCPDTPRYKAIGNAMTVNVVEWIAGRAFEALSC